MAHDICKFFIPAIDNFLGCWIRYRTEYGVFLVEDRRGGMENLTAILTPSKAKKDTAVDIREEHGEQYSPVLTPRNEARDVTLPFALYNKTQAGWMKQYFAFVNFLKQGKDCLLYTSQGYADYRR